MGADGRRREESSGVRDTEPLALGCHTGADIERCKRCRRAWTGSASANEQVRARSNSVTSPARYEYRTPHTIHLPPTISTSPTKHSRERHQIHTARPFDSNKVMVPNGRGQRRPRARCGLKGWRVHRQLASSASSPAQAPTRRVVLSSLHRGEIVMGVYDCGRIKEQKLRAARF